MNVRARPHGRRPAKTFDLEFAGLRYIATAAFYPDGSLGESFIRNHKTGNASGTAVRDAAILLSLLLQHGRNDAPCRQSQQRRLRERNSRRRGRLDSCEVTMSRTGAGSTFAVVFRVRALRALLKTAKSRFNLRCLEAREEARQDSQRLRGSTIAEIPARAGIAPDGSGKTDETGEHK